MTPLEKLGARLDSQRVRHIVSPIYYIFSDDKYPNLGILNSTGILEIRNNDDEKVVIATFDDNNTKLFYASQSRPYALKTLDDLRLPSHWPSNVGEQIFYLLKDDLMDTNGEPVILEAEVDQGCETQLEFVLSKLLRSFEGAKVDKAFFSQR